MGVAEILTGLRSQLHGSVKFIFQPAEEMPPEGEEGGAKLMIEQGALENPGAAGRLRPARHVAAAGRHRRLSTGPDDGELGPLPHHRPGQADARRAPWLGVDPIVTAAQVVLGLQTVVSRGVDITREPAVVTVGMIKGGVRENIIPDSVEMRGTVRTFDEAMRDDIHERVTTWPKRIAQGLARRLQGLHPEELPGDRQRPGADRDDAADLAARRRPRRAPAGAEGDRRRGLLVLPAGRAGPVLLRRRDAARASTRPRPTRTIRRGSSPTNAPSASACARSAQLTCDYFALQA
jgi:hypothetical protein